MFADACLQTPYSAGLLWPADRSRPIHHQPSTCLQTIRVFLSTVMSIPPQSASSHHIPNCVFPQSCPYHLSLHPLITFPTASFHSSVPVVFLSVTPVSLPIACLVRVSPYHCSSSSFRAFLLCPKVAHVL